MVAVATPVRSDNRYCGERELVDQCNERPLYEHVFQVSFSVF